MSNPYDTTVHVPEVSQSSAPNWTPEPWHVGCDKAMRFTYSSQIVGDREGDPFVVAQFNGNFSPLDQANAARAVACVNACKGVTDPAAGIERLKAVEKAADELLETLETERISNVGPYARIEAIRLIQSIGRYNAAKKGDRK